MEVAQTESLGDALHQITMKSALLPSTGDCWCGGTGGRITRYFPPFGDYLEPQRVFGETCVCEAGQREAIRGKRLRQEYDKAEGDAHARLRWQNSGIPARFINFTLITSPLSVTDPDLVHRLLEPSNELDDAANDAAFGRWWGSWYFHGPYGVGKTGLAIGFARQVNKILEIGEALRFVTLPRLLGELRASYNRRKDSADPTEEAVIQKYSTADLLVLDDIGAEQVSGSGWMEDRLYRIIGERHDEQRITAFTSNLSLDDLARRIGDRITWRILEMCGEARIVAVKGPNLRDARA